MAGSQKDQNKLALYAAVLANAVVLYCIVSTQRAEPRAWASTLTELQMAIPAVIGLAFISVLNAQLSSKSKERLVFWEWEHPLPGCRAFSLFLARDSRIDAEALARRFGPFPDAPLEQNRTWYRIYNSVRDRPAVVDASRGYLFARDYAAFVVLMIPVMGGIAFAQVQSPLLCIGFTFSLVLQYALAVNAARRNAERLVTTVMAIAAAE